MCGATRRPPARISTMHQPVARSCPCNALLRTKKSAASTKCGCKPWWHACRHACIWPVPRSLGAGGASKAGLFLHHRRPPLHFSSQLVSSTQLEVMAALRLAFLLGLLAACSASPAAIISANNEAQSIVRTLGIQSQISSRVRSRAAFLPLPLPPAPARSEACGVPPPPTHSA